MAESDLLKAVATYGVGGILAVFMFLLYRRDILEAAKSKAELAQRFEAQAERLDTTIQSNTRVMTLLEGTNAQLSRAVEHILRDGVPGLVEGDHGRKQR